LHAKLEENQVARCIILKQNNWKSSFIRRAQRPTARTLLESSPKQTPSPRFPIISHIKFSLLQRSPQPRPYSSAARSLVLALMNCPLKHWLAFCSTASPLRSAPCCATSISSLYQFQHHDSVFSPACIFRLFEHHHPTEEVRAHVVAKVGVSSNGFSSYNAHFERAVKIECAELYGDRSRKFIIGSKVDSAEKLH
jgi:hypothetical protein